MDSRELPEGCDRSSESGCASGIHVDREGDWYYRNNRITRGDILELFLTSIRQLPGGVFALEWRGQRCALDVEDTPFIVSRVDRIQPDGGKPEQILIRLKHLPDPEVLDLSTLRVGKGNVPYCMVRNGQYLARFSRPAYYQLAAWVEQDALTGTFFLRLDNRHYPISTSPVPSLSPRDNE
ncbi:MAG TPA: DUF1285 domain-containing protein [Syntrophobacteraceae bacterium]|nr:DUF1285 domain-containing protein [Syntrophobacteraceae bacterium]